MKKFLTDMHTHSTYSFDGVDNLRDMLDGALVRGIDFYGISEHFEYGYNRAWPELANIEPIDEELYFHNARHLQEDYQGCMNVAVGAEFGFYDDEAVKKRFVEACEKYHPDFVINSVHGLDHRDFAFMEFPPMITKEEILSGYFQAVRKSLDVPYPYDIVAHFGYLTRYIPFEDKSIPLERFGKEIDDILQMIIDKEKILEVNTLTKDPVLVSVPNEYILRRYYGLGGRKISYGSDAHQKERIGDKREQAMDLLKNIGFTYLTVPFKGEHIKVDL